MHGVVPSRLHTRILGSGKLPSFAGNGLPERMRSTVFAFLGLTAAAGLALVAVFAQLGFPLLSPAPLPAVAPERNGIAEAVPLEDASGAFGLAPPRSAAAAPRASGADGGSAPAGRGRGRVGVDGSLTPVSVSEPAAGPAAAEPAETPPPARTPAPPSPPASNAPPVAAPAPVPVTAPTPEALPASAPQPEAQPATSKPSRSKPARPEAKPAKTRPVRPEPKPAQSGPRADKVETQTPPGAKPAPEAVPQPVVPSSPPPSVDGGRGKEKDKHGK
jgi:hypothetical protein